MTYGRAMALASGRLGHLDVLGQLTPQGSHSPPARIASKVGRQGSTDELRPPRRSVPA